MKRTPYKEFAKDFVEEYPHKIDKKKGFFRVRPHLMFKFKRILTGCGFKNHRGLKPPEKPTQ